MRLCDCVCVIDCRLFQKRALFSSGAIGMLRCEKRMAHGEDDVLPPVTIGMPT
jgi:hypothetical protein